MSRRSSRLLFVRLREVSEESLDQSVLPSARWAKILTYKSGVAMNRLVKSVKIRNANYSGRNGSAIARFAQRRAILFADQMGSLINLFVS